MKFRPPWPVVERSCCCCVRCRVRWCESAAHPLAIGEAERGKGLVIVRQV
jgi:hypothetical protein